MKKAIWILALTAALTGCLEKEVTHTLYIEADGSVTWEVLERNVYSSANTPEEREREEREYFKRAMAGSPEVLDALTEIGGTEARSEMLRDRRPYGLRATARFADLGVALGGLFESAGMDAEWTLERDGERRVLTITPAEGATGSATGSEESDALGLLISDPMLFVLASGKFVESEGFLIRNGDRVAVWSSESEEREPEPERFRLVWTVPESRD
jgi:hypothetical protein